MSEGSENRVTREEVRGKRTDAPEVADCYEDIKDLIASEVYVEGEPAFEEFHLSGDGEIRLRLLLTGLWNSAERLRTPSVSREDVETLWRIANAYNIEDGMYHMGRKLTDKGIEVGNG